LGRVNGDFTRIIFMGYSIMAKVSVGLIRLNGSGKMNHQKVCKTSVNGYIKVTEGIFRKTLVFGINSLLAEFKLEKGKQLPLHKHPQEQVGYLVSGHIILHIDGDNYDILPGDSWAILGDIEHSAEIIEESIAIEIFSPLREDYLP